MYIGGGRGVIGLARGIWDACSNLPFDISLHLILDS